MIIDESLCVGTIESSEFPFAIPKGEHLRVYRDGEWVTMVDCYGRVKSSYFIHPSVLRRGLEMCATAVAATQSEKEGA